MSGITFNQYPQFFTATILEWKPLLEDDEMKDIIINSLRFLVEDGRVIVYASVIMPNHIHIIWRIQDKFEKSKVQQSFLEFTAQKMKFRLIDTGDAMLENYKVKAPDREYQFWERNPLSVDLWTRQLFMQKLNYCTIILHNLIGSCVLFLKSIIIHLSGFMSLEILSSNFYLIMKGSCAGCRRWCCHQRQKRRKLRLIAMLIRYSCR